MVDLATDELDRPRDGLVPGLEPNGHEDRGVEMSFDPLHDAGRQDPA